MRTGVLVATLLILWPQWASAEGQCETAAQIDDYLWSRYEAAPKIDRTGIFEWKDRIAAERKRMTLKEYVIGGMRKSFRERVCLMLEAMEAVGLEPGITSAFRDDFRQSLIKKGIRSRVGRSFHGGSLRGGYGHGVAVDIVAVAYTPKERYERSVILWRWIDEHGKRFGLGRPYRNDPPHVVPDDGKEFAVSAIKRKSKLAKKKGGTKTAKKQKKKLRLASRK